MNNSLSHHGIRGQRWGVRRTQAQLGHAPKKERTSRGYFEQTVQTGKGKAPISPAEKIIGKSNSAINDTANILDSASRVRGIRANSKKTYKDASKMTDQELRDAVNRMNLERQYSSLTNKDTSTGAAYAKEFLSIAGSVTAVAASGVAIAATIKSMKK